VILNDFLLIDELRHWRDQHNLDKPALRRVLEALGDEAAGYLKSVLAPAAEQYPNVIVATHIPPFREAAWYQGRPSADDYLPFFSCKAVGDVLLDVARSYPKCQILVLCGHTHGGGEVQAAENLRVVTGPAEYEKPEIQRIIEVE
jgi:Icc protein